MEYLNQRHKIKWPNFYLKLGVILFLLIEVSLLSAFAQTQVSGTVNDVEGEPLVGATVLIKGTNTGSIVDADGQFTIEVIDPNAMLVFSFIGYLTEEVNLNGQTNIDIVLVEDVTRLDEIVIIGYGTQKKRDLTGSVASVSEDRIRDIPVTNLTSALQGSVAGVNISTYQGQPGSNSTITIRGVKSFNATNDPLVIIDGIPGGEINDIHPDDIKSIQVLKDAAATAIYGARGANGVIIITTNTGKIGKPSVTLSMSYGFSRLANKVDVLSADEYVAKKYEIYRMQHSNYDRDEGTLEVMEYNTAQEVPIDEILAGNELEMYNLDKSYNWLEEITQKAPIQSYNLSLTGGGEKTHYLLSASLVDQTGIIQKSDYTQQSVRANISSNITKWFKAGTNILVNHNKQKNVPFSIFTATYQLSSLGKKYENENHPDSAGYELYPMYPDEFIANPFTEIEIQDIETRTKLLNSTFLDFTLVPGLNYRITLNSVLFYYKRNNYTPLNTKQVIAFDKAENGRIEYEDRLTLNIDNLVSYNNVFGEHQFTGTFVFSIEDYRRDNLWSKARAFGSDYYAWTALQLGDPVAREMESLEERTYLISYIGRLNYDYKGKYLLQFSVRNDRSSKFSKENRNAIFPGVSAGWRISDELFMSNLSFVNDLKVRVSYASTGNQDINYHDRFNVGEQVYYTTGQDSEGQLIAGYKQRDLANKNLRWEKSNQFNIGMDFAFMNTRLSGVIEYYNTLTTDLLWDRSISPISGFESIRDNIGEVENKGIEISLNGIIMNSKNIRLGTSATFSANKTIIIDLDGTGQDFLNDRLFIGEPIGVVYDYVFDGVLQEGESPPAHQADLLPGEVKVKDIGSYLTLEDGSVSNIRTDEPDGEINEADRKIIGQIHPTWFGSFGLNFEYKNLGVSVFINHVHGTTRHIPVNVSDRPHSIDIPYYTNENPSTQFSRPGWPSMGGKVANQYGHLSYYVNGSYTRLQDATIAYNFNNTFLNRLGINNLRLYITGQNLFTITDYIGYDPAFEYVENQTEGRINRIQGYPTIANIILGLKVTF